jgi:hypothetical protein
MQRGMLFIIFHISLQAAIFETVVEYRNREMDCTCASDAKCEQHIFSMAVH